MASSWLSNIAASAKSLGEAALSEAQDKASKLRKSIEDELSSEYERTTAAADAQQCVNLAPTFVKGYFRFATALLQLGGAMHAMIVCQQALQISPGNADLKELLAQCETGVEAASASGGGGS